MNLNIANSDAPEVEDGRTLLRPVRLWPLAIYVILVLAALLVGSGARFFQLQLGSQRYQLIRVIVELMTCASFSAPIGLVAISRLRIADRVRLFLAVLAVKMSLNLAAQLLSLLSYPHGWPQYQLYEWARISINDVRDFAVVIAAAHALSVITTTFVSSQTPTHADAARVLQGRIVDWFYFVVFVSLSFVALWPPGSVSLNAEREAVFYIYRSGRSPYDLLMDTLSLATPLGAATTGLLCLSPILDWRLKSLAVVLIGVVSFLCMSFSYVDGIPEWFLLAIFAFSAVSSFPFWILLRLAGYRAFSPRRGVSRVVMVPNS